MKRVFISGQKHFGAQVFNLCRLLGLEVVGVSAPPFGSDGKRADRLREAAEKAGVPWMPSGTLNQHTLPDNIDEAKIKASFKDGMLNLQIPKTAGSKPKSIEVKVE